MQLGYALKQGIPYMVLFGESELAAGVLKIKDLDAGSEETVPEVGPPGRAIPPPCSPSTSVQWRRAAGRECSNGGEPRCTACPDLACCGDGGPL